jgi:MarR family transcriptional regulator, organic hydroperoxide resistance regulator
MSTPAALEPPAQTDSPEQVGSPDRAEPSEQTEPLEPADPREAQVAALGMAFRRVFRSFSRLRGRDTHLGAGELSHAQFELLIELFERGELQAGELAAAARLTPATVTQMLDHLAEHGHVERVRSQTDRRVVVSRLTPQGRKAIEAKRAAWKARWEQALADVAVDDLSAATRVLERLGAMVEDASPAVTCEQPPQSAGAGAGVGRKAL